MTIDSGNLYALAGAPARGAEGEERFDTLLTKAGVRIERIVSNGQCSPRDFWYDNPHDEWVLLLQGSAGLRLQAPGGGAGGNGEASAEPAPDPGGPASDGTAEREVVLAPGDWVHLPAHCRHRVDWTDALDTTVWLAVHLEAEARPASASPPSRPADGAQRGTAPRRRSGAG